MKTLFIILFAFITLISCESKKPNSDEPFGLPSLSSSTFYFADINGDGTDELIEIIDQQKITTAPKIYLMTQDSTFIALRYLGLEYEELTLDDFATYGIRGAGGETYLEVGYSLVKLSDWMKNKKSDSTNTWFQRNKNYLVPN